METVTQCRSAHSSVTFFGCLTLNVCVCVCCVAHCVFVLVSCVRMHLQEVRVSFPQTTADCKCNSCIHVHVPPPPPPPLQSAAVNWHREVSSCVRASTSARWTTSVCTGPAASAARTSSRERWCRLWGRRTTPAASSAPPASKNSRVHVTDGHTRSSTTQQANRGSCFFHFVLSLTSSRESVNF